MTITLVDTLGGNILVDGSSNTLTTVTAWTGDGADLFATTALNWTSSIIPDATNGGTYDGVIPNTPNKDCTWDITTALFIDIFTAYTGRVTQSVAFVCTDDFTIVGQGSTSQWNTDGNNLDVQGDYDVDPQGSRGMDHDDGGTISVKGNVSIRSGSGGNNMLSPFRIYGGLLTPTLATIHDCRSTGNNNIPDDWIVGENQTMNLIDDCRFNNMTLEAGSSVTSDGLGSHELRLNGSITDPQLATWLAGATNDIILLFQNVNIQPADYGNIRILLQRGTSVVGTWITIGDFSFTSDGGQQDYDVFGTVTVGKITIGSSNDTRGTIATQKSGSVVTSTGDLEILEDDTLVQNKWIIENGAVGNVTGIFTVETVAESVIQSGGILNLTGIYTPSGTALIDWQTGSQVNMAADVIIPDSITQDYDGNITVGVGATSFSFVNPDNNNRFNQLTLTAGCTMDTSGNEYADTLTGPTTLPKATITGTGTFITIDDWQNQDFIDIVADTDGDILLSLGFDAVDAADYGNADVSSTTVTQTTINGTGDAFACHILRVFQSPQNRTTPIQIGGTSNAVVNGIEIGDDVVDTRGGIFGWQSTGSLSIGTFGIICNDIDGIQDCQFISSAGRGPISVLGGDISIGVNCEINLGTYTNTITFDGDFIVDSAATSATDTAKLQLDGANTQIVDIMNAVDRVTICKTGGSIQLNEFNAGDLILEAANGNTYSMDWVQADTHSIADISIVGSGTGRVTCQSTVPASQATVAMTNNGTVFHTDFQDMNFTGGIVFADSKTCDDLGNNTLSDGVTDGIFFTDIQFPVDNIYKTDRVTKKTIERRGQTVPAITLSDLFTGDDWALEFTFTDDGVPIDLSTGVTAIHAAVVSEGNIELIPSTLQADDTTGADWENGKVIVVFNASATSTVIPARNASVEVQVTQTGGNKYTFPRESIRIVQGVIS